MLGEKTQLFFINPSFSRVYCVFPTFLHFPVFLTVSRNKTKKQRQLKAQRLKALGKSEDLQASKAATGGLTRGLFAVVSPRTIGM